MHCFHVDGPANVLGAFQSRDFWKTFWWITVKTFLEIMTWLYFWHAIFYRTNRNHHEVILTFLFLFSWFCRRKNLEHEVKNLSERKLNIFKDKKYILGGISLIFFLCI